MYDKKTFSGIKFLETLETLETLFAMSFKFEIGVSVKVTWMEIVLRVKRRVRRRV